MGTVLGNLSPESAALIARGQKAQEDGLRLVDEFRALAQESERRRQATGAGPVIRASHHGRPPQPLATMVPW
jgi:hypothetical protein